jgi:hypothetical protein
MPPRAYPAEIGVKEAAVVLTMERQRRECALRHASPAPRRARQFRADQDPVCPKTIRAVGAPAGWRLSFAEWMGSPRGSTLVSAYRDTQILKHHIGQSGAGNLDHGLLNPPIRRRHTR